MINLVFDDKGECLDDYLRKKTQLPTHLLHLAPAVVHQSRPEHALLQETGLPNKFLDEEEEVARADLVCAVLEEKLSALVDERKSFLVAVGHEQLDMPEHSL